MAKAFLTEVQQDSLTEWVAGRGEGWATYEEWCDTNLIPEERRFTTYSWRVWVQRKRPKIHAKKAQRQDRLKDYSELDKQKRILILEEAITRLRRMIQEDDLSVLDLIRAEEQIRRSLESIAKERGEFAKAEASKAKDQSALAKLRLLSRQRLNVAAQAGQIVEGQARELPAPAEAAQ